ncbi:nucleotide-binding protein [Pseudomonas aeruginosa]|nr:nucleotide-binding protein [Pseudomonas aeruginosa]
MLEQMLDILRSNLVKRKVDSQCMEIKDAYPSGKVVKQDVNFREGIDKDLAKKIVGLIKERKLKVQAAIQGEQVRVTGKKRDDLQEAIALLARRIPRHAVAVHQLPRLTRFFGTSRHPGHRNRE